MIDIAVARGPAEFADVRVLFEEYAASLDVDLAYQQFESELATLPGEYAAPRGCLLLARDGARLLGCVGVRPSDGASAELKRLYVRPAARGLDLGRRLTGAAVAFARATGYASLRLDTLPTMTRAQALYRTLGFRDIEAYRFSPVAGTVFMELDLSSAVDSRP
jgi:ribosomal protein S18 acetylase RimI-like enzyme